MKYRMPAEWEPHEGTWIAWPHNKEHWPGKFEPMLHVYGNLVKELARAGEKVFICVNNKKMEAEARGHISQSSPDSLKSVKFFHIPTDASWSRDHGPIFVRDENGSLTMEDWIFNAWGQKYAPWDQDDAVPQKIAPQLGLPLVSPGIVMEGGSVDLNGKGTLLTTEQCLLNTNRNPHLNRPQIEKHLADFLGATNILWLKEGIVGDDTDGHIDDIARFTDARTVVCALEENKKDENYEITQKNFGDLQKMKDQDGQLLHVVALPMPDPVIHEGQRLPASYANFYIANTAVLIPTFRCKKDEKALTVLAQLFPGRSVVGIDAVDWVWGLGTIHCSTQQMPKREAL